MNKLLFSLTLTATLFISGCVSSQRFEAGGAYAKTEVAPAMPELYVADAAFDLSYKSLDLVFKYEKDNRATLWIISPKIKGSLDKLRVEASQVWLDYAVARQTYLSTPTPENLDALSVITGKLTQLNAAALAVIATKGK